MAAPQTQLGSAPGFHVAVRGGVDFLLHFSLLDCRINRLLDRVTSLSVPTQTARSLIPSVKAITDGTPVVSLVAEFQDLIRTAGVQR
jgi:hypothetical protein